MPIKKNLLALDTLHGQADEAVTPVITVDTNGNYVGPGGGGTGLTDTQLRATPVPVSGTFWQATQPVSGPATDAQLRATPLPVSGTVSTGGLTDTQLRATAVPVSGTFFQGTQPVSAASLPLPAGASTAAKQPALGTAGAASADVITVQGIASGVAQPVSGTFFQATQPVSLATAPTTPVTGTFWQATQPVSGTVTANAGTGTMAVQGVAGGVAQPVLLNASNLIVSVTAAAAASPAVSLPAAGAGLFHYITRVNIVKYASVAVVGAAAPVVITSTNLPGSVAWTTPTAMAVGTQYETDVEPSSPIKSSVANTATTIVCPATTSIIWRVTVYYYTAA